MIIICTSEFSFLTEGYSAIFGLTGKDLVETCHIPHRI